MLLGLVDAGIELIVVGMTAGILLGVPTVTQDLAIVHRRTEVNVERLLRWLLSHGSYHRFDLAHRKLAPTRDLLLGTGHLNLVTDLGDLDVLCELGPGEGYDDLLADAVLVDDGRIQLLALDLPRLIAVKARAGRAKDRAVLPLLVATLDERQKSRP
jgi:hypothetical protein